MKKKWFFILLFILIVVSIRAYFLAQKIQYERSLCAQSSIEIIGTPYLTPSETSYLQGDMFYPVKILRLQPLFYQAYQIKVRGLLECTHSFQNPSYSGFSHFKIKKILSIQIIEPSSFFARSQKYFFNWIESHLKKYSKVAAFTKAVWTGSTENFSIDFQRFYIEAGAMQIIALSGQHVSILVFLVLFLARRGSYQIKKYIPLLCGALLLWSSLGAESVKRTMAMLLAVFILKARGFYSHPFKIVLMSSLFLFVYDPALIFSVGFFLSVFCTLLLCSLLEVKNKTQILFLTSMYFSLPILVLPLTAHYFSKISLLSVLSNLILNLFWQFFIIPVCFLLPLLLIVLPNFLLNFFLEKFNLILEQFIFFHEFFYTWSEKSYFTIYSPSFLEVLFLEGIMLSVILKSNYFFMMRHS